MHQLAYFFLSGSWHPRAQVVPSSKLEEASVMLVATSKLREKLFNRGFFNVLLILQERKRKRIHHNETEERPEQRPKCYTLLGFSAARWPCPP